MKPHAVENKTTLCLIVWNEVEGCRLDVPRMPCGEFGEIIAIDGGSTDGTVEYLESQGITVYRQTQKSLNAAYVDAVKRARYDKIVVFFPKGTIDPGCVLDMRKFLDQGYALVVASRCIKGGHNEEDDRIFKPRKWGGGCLAAFASMVWRKEGNKIHDVLHGVKGFTKKSYARMQISEVGVTVDLEMAVRAYRQRESRIEIPVVEQRRDHGETKFKIWPTGKRLAGFLLNELIKR
jgi:glycosyltransferase involved in cell wall biosynthesis